MIGDDILGQSSGGNTAWLLYDGHGSTRALSGRDAQDQPTLTARYSFDAYGCMLGGDPTLSKPADTDMLYSGEQFDPGLQQQYLRARYYDQKAGFFASLDPFAGSTSDPQSLHKYAYCQGDGVNGLDPTGMFTLIELLIVIAVVLFVATAIFSCLPHTEPFAGYRLGIVDEGMSISHGASFGSYCFVLDRPTPLGGVVIQQIRFDYQSTTGGITTDIHDGYKSPQTYWESFIVRPGSKTSQADYWRWSTRGTESGNVTVTAEAQFFEGKDKPSCMAYSVIRSDVPAFGAPEGYHDTGDSHKWSGGIPSTTKKPDRWWLFAPRLVSDTAYHRLVLQWTSANALSCTEQSLTQLSTP